MTDAPTLTVGDFGAPALQRSQLGLSLLLRADPDELSTPAQLGEALTYTLELTNFDNRPAEDLTVTIFPSELSEAVHLWPASSRSLTPGQTEQFTLPYRIAHADLAQRQVTCRASWAATVTGQRFEAEPVELTLSLAS